LRLTHRSPLENHYAKTESRARKGTAQRLAGYDAFSRVQKRPLRSGVGRGSASLLGSRLLQGSVGTGGNQLTGQRIDSPGDLAALAQVYRDPRFETFRAIFVRNGDVVGESAYSSRLPGAVQLPVDYAQQIATDMARFGADGYYMLHNHPSGHSNASTADINLTKGAAQIAPGLLSHVIVDHHEYTIIDINGSPIERTVKDKKLSGPDFHSSPSLDHPMLGVKIISPKDVAVAAKALQADGSLQKSPVMIMTKGQYSEVDLIASVPLSILPGNSEKTARAQAWLRGVGRAEGAGAHSFLCVSKADFKNKREQLSWLMRQGMFTDVVSSDGDSLGTEGVHADWGQKKTFGIRRPGSRVSESLADDVEAQERWLTEGAEKLGYASIDAMLEVDYPAFVRLAEQWRNEHEVADALYQPGADYGAVALPGDYPDSLAAAVTGTNMSSLYKAGLLAGESLVPLDPPTDEKPKPPMVSPAYRAAKRGGNGVAAGFVVAATIRQKAIDAIAGKLAPNVPVVFVSVKHKDQSESKNAIPIAYAIALSRAIGGGIDKDIVKISGKANTGVGVVARANNEQLFDGPVRSEVQYVVVDDVFTSGSTVTALIAHIQSRGGNVAAVTALAAGKYQNYLRHRPQDAAKVLEKTGSDEVRFEHETGIPFASLTGSEIYRLANLDGGWRGYSLIRERFSKRSRIPAGGNSSLHKGSGILSKNESASVRAYQIYGAALPLDFGRSPEFCKSIPLIFPNGNEHVLGSDQYSDSDDLLKAQAFRIRFAQGNNHRQGRHSPHALGKASQTGGGSGGCSKI
jgi:hypothetical protein